MRLDPHGLFLNGPFAGLNMGTSRHFLPLLFALIATNCAATELNSHPTCKLLAPPPEAGENSVHAQLLKVYPRRSSLGKKFSGCQTIWLDPPGEAGAQDYPKSLIRLHFQSGTLVAAQMEGKLCRYTANGKAVGSNSSICPPEAPEAFLSEPPGCISDPKKRAMPNESCPSEQ